MFTQCRLNAHDVVIELFLTFLRHFCFHSVFLRWDRVCCLILRAWIFKARLSYPRPGLAGILILILYYLASCVEFYYLEVHETKAVKDISTEEKLILWLNFNPEIALTVSWTTHADFLFFVAVTAQFIT